MFSLSSLSLFFSSSFSLYLTSPLSLLQFPCFSSAPSPSQVVTADGCPNYRAVWFCLKFPPIRGKFLPATVTSGLLNVKFCHETSCNIIFEWKKWLFCSQTVNAAWCGWMLWKHRVLSMRWLAFPGLCRKKEKQPVINGGSTVNEKSTGKHKALNAQPYWLLTRANNIAMALTETNHTFPMATIVSGLQ